MRSLLLVLAGAVGGAAGRAVLAPAWAGDPPRAFGPEWVQVGTEHQRAVMVKVTHHTGGNVSGYELKMEHNTVWATEIDGGQLFSLISQNYGELRVLRDAKGKALDLSARLGSNHYIDIDGDGMMDGLSDQRDGKDVTMILLGDRLVRVKSRTGNFRYPANQERVELGFDDPDVWFLFENGAWKQMSRKVREPK